jgi:hypothetical protein
VELVATNGFVKDKSLLIARVAVPPRFGTGEAACRSGSIVRNETKASPKTKARFIRVLHQRSESFDYHASRAAGKMPISFTAIV